MSLLALDFDGVICDSAAETAASAWRCARQLWPADFPEPEAPAKAISAFCTVRPFLETGYQSILMLKMLQEKLPQEAFQKDLEHHLARLMQETALGPAELKRLFGDCRDQWIQQDLTGWLNTHRFYPGVIAALQQALSRKEVVILTTKQERFVLQLLSGQGVDCPAAQVWGLERQPKKELALLQFLNQGAQEIIFVEDRLQTLELVASIPALDRVRLCYAPWGYGTPAELTRARQSDRVRLLTLPEFVSLLNQ
ncbi:MAG: HAD family hydrolase [Oligosphaeraceae bacterium]|nr:HAD family hydrolase [Oligosphaeraceae bacterium]